tara:strand:+ start:16809 stop:16985 length:177 start_codon:yes stop_codon:yes gene_type:complete
MIVRLKSGELQELNLKNFINENDIYKFIKNEKFEKIKTITKDDNIKEIINIIKKKPYK